ncbi:T9SS type A sorting domain-containing protein [candidate division WOR-3 bacterium]|nr:T9SS type A sorting domain-containing protein [candidate division WOR-3 bacterium]
MFCFLLAVIGFSGQAGETLVSFGTRLVDTSEKTDSSDIMEDYIVIWPAQVHNTLNVSLTYSFGESISVELYNVIGIRVLKAALEGPRTSIDVSRLDRGVYFVTVIMGDIRRTTRRVIVY